MTTPKLPTVRHREINPSELAALSPRPRVIDVREPDEFSGDLGHIPGAELVPLATLAARARRWSKSVPIVVVCRSGARSTRAALELAAAGFTDVTNLAGGTVAYVSAGLAVER